MTNVLSLQILLCEIIYGIGWLIIYKECDTFSLVRQVGSKICDWLEIQGNRLFTPGTHVQILVEGQETNIFDT